MDPRSLFSGNNVAFLEELYREYLADPKSVDPSWVSLFSEVAGAAGAPRIAKNGNGAVALPYPPNDQAILEEAVARMIHTFRLRGHLAAKVDPLGRPVSPAPTLNPAYFGLSDEHLEREFQTGTLFLESVVPLREILRRLNDTYCRTIGVEYMHMPETEERMWLQAEMERCENRATLSVEDQRHLLSTLSYTEGFEQFLHTKYMGAKRFSLSGNESLIPLIDTLLEEAGEQGVRDIVIGMAHRGRLNVLTNVMGKSPVAMFSEFEHHPDPRSSMGTGDVKYHMGYSSDHVTRRGYPIHLSLAFNPSHLEAIDPVVLGRVRAKQDRHSDPNRTRGMGLLIHGDAAFAGQGVVAETLNLASLEGYTTGGTIHIVVNNQIGFTTFPEDSRSTFYATDIAHMLKIPIFHVNGDDPEAAVYVARLAQRFRQKFHKNVVIDLVGYRRYGHNEMDEPTYTQPLMYKLIQEHASVRKLYAQALDAQGRIPLAESEGLYRRCMEEFQKALEETKANPPPKTLSYLGGLWAPYTGGPEKETPEKQTAVPREVLAKIFEGLITLPEGFKLHPKLSRFLEARAVMARGERPIDWATGEALAFGSLLWDGARVRLSGQDCRRGTFSQRHVVLTDVETGQRYAPLSHLAERQGLFEVYDSPLSEAGVLGFEFGYSLDTPDALVIWEAQFGDFVNNAQVVLDQFLSSAEDKWKRLSGLALLLPHGYEGQGPEHSSARLERFLQLCAEDNMQIVVPTTPAQLFHMLRRQVVRPYRKPLVVFTPKSLLRHQEAVSSIEDITQGSFQRVIADRGDPKPEAVRRVILSAGKIFYELEEERKKRADERTVLLRLEQLYPFPAEELLAQLTRYPKAKELFWVQEEPENMGAWTYMAPRLTALTHGKLPPRYIGREASASPATGSHDAHILEQAAIVTATFAENPSVSPQNAAVSID
jgi:2-oxoglutarate dehydrogenase E1 component